MDRLAQEKTRLLADYINRFLEPKPEYSGVFWSAEELAKTLVEKLDELEVQDMWKWHEVLNGRTPF